VNNQKSTNRLDLNGVEEILRDILESQLAVSSDDISSSDVLSQLNIDTDDLSFLFIPEVERKFGIKLSINEWSELGTLGEISMKILEIKKW
jgi:acyl carrier protein